MPFVAPRRTAKALGPSAESAGPESAGPESGHWLERATPPADPSERLAWLAWDPVRFARGLLRHDIWGVQEEILRSVATHPRTAVKACHASGKTFTAADALMWWTVRYPDDGIVVTTAPTWTQVEKLLWGAVHKAAATGGVKFPPIHKTELPIGPENYALGLSTNEGVRFQGWHGRILIILDEAPGVLAEIYEAIEGIRAGGHVHVLLLGNPILASGPFYEPFTSQRARWNTFTISAFDTPNFRWPDGPHAGMQVTLEHLLAMPEEALDQNVRSYLTTRRWVREKYEEWGPGHPLWESKVLGQFPEQSEDALISLAWLEAAKARAPLAAADDEWAAGVDVAGPGEDETVVKVRHGPDVVASRAWHEPDPRGAVVAFLAPFRHRLARVNVDSNGIGYNFGLHLRDQGLPVELVNVGEAARHPERFKLLKAEFYWALRERFEQGRITGLLDETTLAQLAGIRYEHIATGQVKIESKDDARARGVKSPDRAEALMLAFAPAPPVPRRAAPPPPSESYVTI